MKRAFAIKAFYENNDSVVEKNYIENSAVILILDGTIVFH